MIVAAQGRAVWDGHAGTLRALLRVLAPRWLLGVGCLSPAARRRWRRLLAPTGARSASAAQAAGSAHSPAVIDVDATSKVDCERCRLQRERTSNSAGVSGGADAVAVAAGCRHIRKTSKKIGLTPRKSYCCVTMWWFMSRSLVSYLQYESQVHSSEVSPFFLAASIYLTTPRGTRVVPTVTPIAYLN